MLPLVCCALTLATIAYAVVRLTSRFWRPDRSCAVRWIPSPYRSPRPMDLVVSPGNLATIVRLAAWASFVECCLVAPCLAFALARLRLEALTPIVFVWLVLAIGHGWCGCALIRRPTRAAAEVRSLAQASLALAVPFFLVGATHFVWVNPTEYDPCTPSLPVPLVFVSLTIVHALLMLVATRGFLPGERRGRPPEWSRQASAREWILLRIRQVRIRPRVEDPALGPNALWPHDRNITDTSSMHSCGAPPVHDNFLASAAGCDWGNGTRGSCDPGIDVALSESQTRARPT
jgi:hypothetical protein